MLWVAEHGHPRRRSTAFGARSWACTTITCPTWTTVAETAAPYYNNHLRGGEGHMEVGKLILNVAHKQGDT